MGGTTFCTRSKGKTPRESFDTATAAARHEYGHGGYTGTIAEKVNFTLIQVPAGQDPRRYANQLLDEGDPRVDDKWGPAGCIKLVDGEYLFFGWASE